MALTEEQLKQIAKNTKTTQVFLKSLYSNLWRTHGKDKVDVDFLFFHLKKIKELEYTVKEYCDEHFIKIDPNEEAAKENKVPKTKAEIQESLHAELNRRVANNMRVKYGISKPVWNKIIRYEKIMTAKLKVIVPEFAEKMVLGQVNLDTEEAVNLFLRYEKNWKEFCRVEIINKYPGSDKSGKTRDNILNLFAERVSSIIDKSSKQ